MSRTVFTGGLVFDGTGAPPAIADIVVQDGWITEIGTALDGDEAVDCAGLGVLPGLFDCHVHVNLSHTDLLRLAGRPFGLEYYEAAANMRSTLATGITTVRDAGGADLGVKTARDLGMIPGPRMQISIRMVSQTGGHGDKWSPCGQISLFPEHAGRPRAIADGPDEVRRIVRQLIRAGADVIKVATSGGVFSPRDNPRHAHFREPEIAVLVEEATAAGIHVMAHCNSPEGIKASVRHGVRSIEHGAFLDDEGIDLMLSRGTWLVPTLCAPKGVAEAAKAGVDYPDYVRSKLEMVAEAAQDAARRAVEAGVRIALGTDAPVHPHGKNLRELELLVECGMTPAQALHAATLSSARLLGLEAELGSLEPGKRADLVLVEGSPLALVGQQARIRSVYQDGRLCAGRAG